MSKGGKPYFEVFDQALPKMTNGPNSPNPDKPEKCLKFKSRKAQGSRV